MGTYDRVHGTAQSPNGDMPMPSLAVQEVLHLLEDAGVPGPVNDRIVVWIEEVEAESARVTRWINDLHSGMWINCVYCGHRYGPNDGEHLISMREVLHEHVKQCPKHPLSKALLDNASLSLALDKMTEGYQEIADERNKLRAVGKMALRVDNFAGTEIDWIKVKYDLHEALREAGLLV